MSKYKGHMGKIKGVVESDVGGGDNWGRGTLEGRKLREM